MKMNTYGILIRNTVDSNFNHSELGFMRGVLAALGIGSYTERSYTGDFTAFIFNADDVQIKTVLRCLDEGKVHFRKANVKLEIV